MRKISQSILYTGGNSGSIDFSSVNRTYYGGYSAPLPIGRRKRESPLSPVLLGVVASGLLNKLGFEVK